MVVKIVPRTTGGLGSFPVTVTVPGHYIEREQIKIDTDTGRATAVLDWLIYDLPPTDENRRVVAAVAADAVLALSVEPDPEPDPAKPLGWIPPSPTVTSVGGTSGAMQVGWQQGDLPITPLDVAGE